MPQIYFFATLSGNGCGPIDCRYLHATRKTREEAEEDCRVLNEKLISAGYRVVGDEE